MAAAGARVTSFDNSDEQLARDQLVADREGLAVRIVQGDMQDISVFADASFDLIFHPVANLFVPDIRPVWQECARVLRPGGRLLSGFMNSMHFFFDHNEAEQTGQLVVKYRLPYSDLTSLPPDRLKQHLAEDSTLEFGHSLDDVLDAVDGDDSREAIGGGPLTDGVIAAVDAHAQDRAAGLDVDVCRSAFEIETGAHR